MLRITLAFLLLIAAASLTAEINNIHYGYRNIYIGSASLSGSSLTVKDYRLTKQELEKEDTPFIKNEGKDIEIDINQLVRQYEVDELDPSSPILTYRFLSRPSIVVTLSSESSNDDEANLLMEASALGLDAETLDM